jgi:predicted heme/steroid binding protein
MRKSTVILLAAGVALTTAISMSPAQAGGYTVSASISTSSAQSGEGPVIKGSLSPATPNKLVYLDRYVDGAWTNVTTDYTDSSGKYGERLTLAQLNYDLGSMKFRTRVYNTANTKYVSGTVTKSIYGWLPLAELHPYYDVSDLYWDGGTHTFTVDGVQAGDDGWMNDDIEGGFGVGLTKWNLQEKCIKLRGFAGIDDESGSGGIGKLYIGQDGTSYDYSRSFSLGDFKDFGPSPLNLHLTHYLSIRSKSLTPDDDNVIVGVGEPEVLCKKILPFDS